MSPPYVPTEPGPLDPPKSGTELVLEAQARRMKADCARDTQIEYLALQMEQLEKRLPTPEQAAWLAQRTKDAENLRWLKGQIRAHAPWLLPVFGVLGAMFVWFSSNVISIVPKQ
jgi:hypothetical protein